MAEGQDQAGVFELEGCNKGCICEYKKVLLTLKE